MDNTETARRQLDTLEAAGEGAIVQTVYGTEGELVGWTHNLPYTASVYARVVAFPGGKWTPGVSYLVPAECLKICRAA